jgi:hypothetical protein
MGYWLCKSPRPSIELGASAMREFKNENFYQLYDRGDQLLIEDMKFEQCTFTRCAISLTAQFGRMSTVRNVELSDCAFLDCQTGPTVLSNVSISNLRTSDLFIVWCPYLDRVKLSGNIGKMKINAEADTSTYGPNNYARQKPFDDYRDRFYAGVDWALDISEARFKEFDIRGVPARLIRRDPESQVLITRERALQVVKPGWEGQLYPTNKLWPFMINLFLADGDADTVLVAPLAAAKAKRDLLLQGLQELRRIGLAEPD